MMKNSLVLCLCSLAFSLPSPTTALAAAATVGGGGSSPKKLRLKGAKKSSSSTTTANNVIDSKLQKQQQHNKQQIRDDQHRVLHPGHQGKSDGKHPDKMKGGKKYLHGPFGRSCKSKTNLQKWDGGNSNVGRNGGDTDKKGGGSKGGGNQKQEVSMTCESLPRTATSNDGSNSRGIFLDPSTAVQDKIKYKIKTDNKGISIKVEYKKEYFEAYGVDEYTDSKTSFEVLFDSIVEYAKVDNMYGGSRTDEEQAYDWQNDIIVQTLPLTTWNNFTGVIESVDGVFSHFGVKSSDQKAYFKFTTSRSDFGQSVTANSMKIDVRITNFPWLRSDTNVALMSTVQTSNKVEMSYNDQAFTAAGRDSLYDTNGNMIPQQQQEQPKHTKWARNVEVSFDEAIDTIGFVPFGDYSWESDAQAIKTNASTTAAQNLFTDLCSASLLEYAQSMDPYATKPPGCEEATLPPEMDPNLNNNNPYAYTGGGSQSSSYPIVATTAGIHVVATSPPPSLYGYETHQHIAYSFVGKNAQRAKEIYWDPKAGIGYLESDDAAAAAEGGGSSSSGSSAGSLSSKGAIISPTWLSLIAPILVVGWSLLYGL